MEKYNYLETVTVDIKDYITDNDTAKQMFEDGDATGLYDLLFNVDCVTGNGSGSYTFDTWKAEENICHNWDLLAEALAEFGYTEREELLRSPETCDVIMRCYVLAEAISIVMKGGEA